MSKKLYQWILIWSIRSCIRCIYIFNCFFAQMSPEFSGLFVRIMRSPMVTWLLRGTSIITISRGWHSRALRQVVGASIAPGSSCTVPAVNQYGPYSRRYQTFLYNFLYIFLYIYIFFIYHFPSATFILFSPLIFFLFLWQTWDPKLTQKVTKWKPHGLITLINGNTLAVIVTSPRRASSGSYSIICALIWSVLLQVQGPGGKYLAQGLYPEDVRVCLQRDV